MSQSEKPGEVVLRPAAAADAPAMAECVRAAYEHYVRRIGKPPGPMLDDYAQVVASHRAHVAVLDGRVVGVLVLIIGADGVLLDNVAVSPAAQGRGLGRRLMQLAESEALAQGYDHIELYTHVRMTENIDIYRRLGYEETDRRVVRGYERVYMRKSLTPGRC